MTRSRDIATAVSKAVQAGTLTATGTIGADVQFNQEGTLAVTTGTARWYAPRNITINKIEGFLGTAGTGSSTTFATLVNGSQSRTDSISAGSTSSSTTGLSISVSDGQYLTVNITAVGTNAADLSVKFYYT